MYLPRTCSQNGALRREGGKKIRREMFSLRLKKARAIMRYHDALKHML